MLIDELPEPTTWLVGRRADEEELLDSTEVEAAKLAFNTVKGGTLEMLLLTLDTVGVLTTEEPLLNEADITAVGKPEMALDRTLDDSKLLEMLDVGKTLDESEMLDDERVLELLGSCNTLEDCKMLEVDRPSTSKFEDGITLDDCKMLDDGKLLDKDRMLDNCATLDDGTMLEDGKTLDADSKLDNGKLIEVESIEVESRLDDGKALAGDTMLDDCKLFDGSIMLDDGEMFDGDRMLEMLDGSEMLDVDMMTDEAKLEDSTMLVDGKISDAGEAIDADRTPDDGNALDMESAACEEATPKLIVEEDAAPVLPPILSVVLEEATGNGNGAMLEVAELAVEELCKLTDDKDVDDALTPGRMSMLVLPTSMFIALLGVAELDTDCSMLEVEMRSAPMGWIEEVNKEPTAIEGDEVTDGATRKEPWLLVDVDMTPEVEVDSEEMLENSPKSGELDDAASEALKESCDTDIEFETLAGVGTARLADIVPDMEANEFDTVWPRLRSDRLLDIAV